MARSATAASGKSARKVIARNKRAFHDYFISDRYEAGLVLTGSEVKSLRTGKANLSDAYAEIRAGEVFLISSHIPPYSHAHYGNHEPRRMRKLLLHKLEIRKLTTKLVERGFTLVPLEMYFVNGRAKLELGLAKGKREYDKRQSVRARDAQRDAQQAMGRRR